MKDFLRLVLIFVIAAIGCDVREAIKAQTEVIRSTQVCK